MLARDWKHQWLPLCLEKLVRTNKKCAIGESNKVKSKLACILEASESTRMRVDESLVHGGQLQLCHNQGHLQDIKLHSGSPREVSQGTRRCPQTASKLLMIVSGTATRAHHT